MYKKNVTGRSYKQLDGQIKSNSYIFPTFSIVVMKEINNSFAILELM